MKKNLLQSKKLLISVFFIILFIFLLIIAVIYSMKNKNRSDNLVTEYTAEEVQEEAKEIISQYDQDDNHTFDNVEKIVEMGNNAIDPMLELLKSEDVFDKWTALYSLSRLGFDEDDDTRQKIIDAVSVELENEIFDIQIMAAGIMTIFGEKGGMEKLIEGLSSDNIFMLSEPPILICQYSNQVLSHYTGQDLSEECGIDAIDENGAKKWKDWYEKNGDSITWNNSTKSYSI